jgi:hypothetical protein
MPAAAMNMAPAAGFLEIRFMCLSFLQTESGRHERGRANARVTFSFIRTIPSAPEFHRIC